MIRLFSSLRVFRLRRNSLAALGAALLFIVPNAVAANLPEWMQELTHVSLPSYPAETKGVVLLDEEVTTIRDNGDVYTVHRWAAKILRKEGRELSQQQVRFSNDTKLTWLKAWSVDAKSTVYELKEKDAIETAMFSDEAFSDIKHKVMFLPAAEPGAIIGYEYQQKERPYLYGDARGWWSSDHPDYPVRRARLSVSLPAGWEIDHHWANYKDMQPTVAGNTYTWEVIDIAAVERQPEMPVLRSLEPRLFISYRPASGAAKAKAHTSWAELSTWAYGLTNPRRQSTPRTQDRAKALTAGATTPLEKIRAIAAFAQRDVRYVAIEIGIGGYQPHFASDVLAHGYGDCKDKATVMSAMLHDVGIESDLVLADVYRGVVVPDIPANVFNHAVLAIHLPADVKTDNLPAVIVHPKLGKLLIFDPTDDLTPVGYLPYYLQDNYGLLVRETGGDIIHMPLHDPNLNKLTRTAKMSLDANGTLSGTVEEVRTGSEAHIARARMLSAKGTDRAKILESFLGHFLGSFQLTKASIGNLEVYDQPLVIDYEFVAQNYAKVAGNLLLVPPRVLGSKTTDLLEDGKKRNFPVTFEAAEAHFDDFQITLPAGYEVDELPEPAKIDTSFAQYKSNTAFENGTLRYRREYERKSVLVPLENVSELQKLYREIGSDERGTAVLKRK
jgi:transglutaminase-like putative cysteine protease